MSQAHSYLAARSYLEPRGVVGHRDFDVRSRVRDRLRVTLVLRGEFDLAAVDLFTTVVAHQLNMGRRFIRLDMSGVTFLDCAMLRALVLAHNQLLAHRGQLTLTRVGPRVAKLLRLTELDTALHVVSWPQEAAAD